MTEIKKIKLIGNKLNKTSARPSRNWRPPQRYSPIPRRVNHTEMGDEEIERKFGQLDLELAALRNQIRDNACGMKVPALITPPKYDGTTDFTTYLRHFNKYATAANWQPMRCVQMLPVLLTGDARTIYDLIPDNRKSTWANLTSEMTTRTAKIDQAESA